jgi:hypothetical protein
MPQDANARSHKAVYTVVEGKDDKSYWRQLGVAFVNRDGSINVLLDALPVNGRLQIRDAEPRTGESDRAGADVDDPDAEH